MAQLISIQERGEIEGGWRAAVIFNNGPEHSITISDPFSEMEEQELEWYFEEHLEFPFTKKVRAQNAANSIAFYGEKLFNQVFGDRDIYDEYRDILKSGLNDLRIEIAGSPRFHALHWEALKDPRLQNQHPLAMQAVIVRKNLHPQNLAVAVRPSPTINLLIVTARPASKRDVGYRTISRPLVESLRSANLRVQVDILRPGTYRALENHLREIRKEHSDGYYHVIHLDVHGAVLPYAIFQAAQKEAAGNPYQYKNYARKKLEPYEGVKAFLSFEPEEVEKESRSDLVEASELAALLVEHHIPITILNTCQSGKQIGERETSLGSRLIQEGVQLVLAMGYSVTVSAAELLMSTLYQQLFNGTDLSIAIREARAELYNYKERRAYFDQIIDLEDWLLLVVYQNASVTLQPREFTPPERAAWFEHKAEEKSYIPPEPTYGFVGRDLDILQIEKRLLAKRNMLLVRGMGGAGKTTLLRHLGGWWHTTGFAQRVFYFGYDAKAWTLQQIMMEMAQQLYGPHYYTDFQPLSPKAQQAMLANDLRGTNHLLMLDNLESITGAHLAIQHTLPKEEQDALHSFLTDLARGKTRVLLGSRSGEEWLSKGTFDDSIYDLPGLDDEAASMLADRILEKCNAVQYRHDERLRTLIRLLDGFPLAIEVVLANLAKQTPQEILEALQAGDVKIDPHSDSQERTVSILRCIDYSHSNLSPDAQQLLLCLAPFTSVFWTEESILNGYINKLRQQSILTNLPFDRRSEVLREVQNWGLLSPHEVKGYLHMQPTLAYFLRNRLNESEQMEVRRAIETAFREHYNEIGSMLSQLLRSKEPRERQIGQLLTGLEYENLMTALKLGLEAQVSVGNFYFTLSAYLDTTQDQYRGLELGQMVMPQLETYPLETLIGSMSFDFAGVIFEIATRQLSLKLYTEAEISYQKALTIWIENKSYDSDIIKKQSAVIYHQLGMVAEEQRQWQQAEQYYQQALHLKIECNDRYSQASTYVGLGAGAQEQQQWQQAEHYCQQALQIYIEYNDRYNQANTYGQLGLLVQEQRQWQQAGEYLLQALQIFIDYKDNYSAAGTIYHLARLWKDSDDVKVRASIAKALGKSVEETEKMLLEMLGEQEEEQTGGDEKKE